MSLKWNEICLWKPPPKNSTWCFLSKIGNFVCSFVPVFTILSHPVSLHVHSSSCQPFSFRMDLYLPPNCICLCSPLAFPVSWSHSNGICLCWACVDSQKVLFFAVIAFGPWSCRKKETTSVLFLIRELCIVLVLLGEDVLWFKTFSRL